MPTDTAHASPSHRLHPFDRERIEACCSHARIPDRPRRHGWRSIDLGGERPAYQLRRVGRPPYSGSLALVGAVALVDGGAPAPGQPAIARIEVTLGVERTSLRELLDSRRDPGWRTACAELLSELAALELYEPADCPLCAS